MNNQHPTLSAGRGKIIKKLSVRSDIKVEEHCSKQSSGCKISREVRYNGKRGRRFLDFLVLPQKCGVTEPNHTITFSQTGCFRSQPVTTVDERIPIVHSLIIWKMCEALDLKAKFVPLTGTAFLPRTPYRGVDKTTTALVVGSFSVWKVCQALHLPATYDPQLIRTTVFRKKKPHKPIPVLQSTVVFELCKVLHLSVELAPQ
ncbi:hypothetical protein TNCV_4786871 [Trichonephila clavipes]|nr:hypothetical protein TNCV_4786871 [Trichonephila clavipes]